MPKKLHAGERFGKWTVLSFNRNEITGERTIRDLWNCRCDCGKEYEVDGRNLRSNKSKQCRTCMYAANITHGLARQKGKQDKAYSAWRNMRQRCYRKTHPGYENYGARGITVCERWKDSFANFLEDMGEPAIGLSLERVDNNLGYSKDNCIWATNTQQANNKRVSKVYVTASGEQIRINDLVAASGVAYAPILYYIRRNGIDKAVSHYRRTANAA